jgi:hypothetical protein
VNNVCIAHLKSCYFFSSVDFKINQLKAHMNTLKKHVPVTLALLCSASSAVAIELSSEVVIEIQSQKETEHNHTFLRTEVASTLTFSEHWFIDGVLVLEPLDRERLTKRSRTFDREGVFAEELKLNYQHIIAGNTLQLFIGKFNPAFGTAWDARGIWGEDFAENYEITEKLGTGAVFTLQTESLGSHTVSASSFFSDTSALSQSIISTRGRTNKRDGGAANTEDLSSYAIAVDGRRLGGSTGLNYHLAYRSLKHGDADISADDESGYAATINYAHQINQRTDINLLLERIDIKSFDGTTQDRIYNTSSLITTIDNRWNITLSHTQRVIDSDNASKVYDHLFQLSGGYDFANGLTLDIGWRQSDEENRSQNTLGILGRYAFDF